MADRGKLRQLFRFVASGCAVGGIVVLSLFYINLTVHWWEEGIANALLFGSAVWGGLSMVSWCIALMVRRETRATRKNRTKPDGSK